jgi:hypothetical protein
MIKWNPVGWQTFGDSMVVYTSHALGVSHSSSASSHPLIICRA